MAEEIKRDCFFRVPRPVMELLTNTEDAFSSYFFKQHRTFINKLLEWSFFFFLAYFGYSYGWLLFILSIYHIKYQDPKDEVNENIVLNEREFYSKNLCSLPSWVSFPDFDRADWINQILFQLWPNVDSFATTFVKTVIEPKLYNAFNMLDWISGLSGFEIPVSLNLELGSIPPRVEGIKAYDKKCLPGTDKEEIILDCDVVYDGDARVILAMQALSVQITDVKFRAMARVQLKPLIHRIPFIGGFELYFLKKPELDYKLGGIGTFGEIPGISNVIKSIVDEIICSKFVWPNRLRLYLPSDGIKDQNKAVYMSPKPAGLLKITLEEARNLMKTDKYFGGLGSSDPYAIISIGERKVSFRNNYVPGTANPTWKYSTTFVIEHTAGQSIDIEVYDYIILYNGCADGFLGKITLQLTSTIQEKTFDKWVNLSGGEDGEVHIVCDWRKARPAAELKMGNLNGLYIVSVFVDKCKSLNGGNGNGVSLYCKCKIKLLGPTIEEEYTTQARNKSENPVFERGYMFTTSEDPNTDKLLIQVIDVKDIDKNLGTVTIPLNYLLASPDQELIDISWPLEGGHPKANIYVSAKLYALE